MFYIKKEERVPGGFATLAKGNPECSNDKVNRLSGRYIGYKNRLDANWFIQYAKLKKIVKMWNSQPVN